MARRPSMIALALAAALSARTLDAATIRVPGDAKKIQAAIEMAGDGDEVLVAAGEYRERIDFLGKAIRVASEEGPARTTIAGPPFVPIDGVGSVVLFRNGETREAVLEGFTIADGTGTGIEGGGGIPRAIVGGGILVAKGSRPTIRGNAIRKNILGAAADTPTAGAGIAIIEESSPLVEANEIEGNRAQAGGGIAIVRGSNPTLHGNRVLTNEAEYGGGIFVAEGSGPIIEGNEVRANAASWGAGFYIQSVPSEPTGIAVPLAVLERNEILGNRAGIGGGGICLYRAEVRIGRSWIAENVAASPPFDNGWGGGIYAESSRAQIASVAILENVAYSGAGIFIQGPESAVRIQYATIARNSGTIGGGICMYPDPVAGTEIVNSILWENRAFYQGLPNLYNGDLSMVRSCDFSDGLFEGKNGNFKADPLFRDLDARDIHLREGSPCIDRGEPLPASVAEFDIDGDPRVLDGNGDGRAVPDVGADEFVPQGRLFIRGSCNATPGIDLSDPIFLLNYLFSSGSAPDCPDACDANDDGGLDLGDPIYVLNYLFAGGPVLPSPFPGCGIDPTADALDCPAFPWCP